MDIPDSVSVKVAEVRLIAVVFASVNVMVDVSPVVIVAGLNALVIVGLANTVRSTLAEGDPTDVWFVVTPLVTFGFNPATLEVTTIVIVQLPLAGIVIPLKVRLVAPAI